MCQFMRGINRDLYLTTATIWVQYGENAAMAYNAYWRAFEPHTRVGNETSSSEP